MDYIFPSKLKKFFLINSKKFSNNLTKLDYNTTPWVVLDKKLNDCEQYIELIKTHSKSHSKRYLPEDMCRGIVCHTLYSYTDRDAFRKHSNDTNALERLEYKINPDGGFKHFGNVTGDFIIVKGSVPGTYRRLIKLRKQIRNEPKKLVKPNVLEVVI